MKKVVVFILVFFLLTSVMVVPTSAIKYDFATTYEYFEILQNYIEECGEFDEEGIKTISSSQSQRIDDEEIVYYFELQNCNDGILFKSCGLPKYEVDATIIQYSEFTLYKTNNNISVYYAIMYYDDWGYYDTAAGSIYIDRATYNPKTVYPFNFSGNIIISAI